MWEYLKEVYAGAFAIMGISWVLVHLVLIQVQGIVRIYEPSAAILWIEIAFTALILALLIERLIKDIKKRR